MIGILIKLSEKGLLPDLLIRFGIKLLLKKRLQSLVNKDERLNAANKKTFIKDMDSSPIALVPDLANDQHYEIPSNFYDLCLGSHKKYSSCFWDKASESLQDAEALSLKITCDHAQIKDGQDILELGCGWGSLSLWMATKFPNSKITSVSNSSSQKKYILKEAKKRNIKNLKIITCDMNDFKINKKFDRVVSVEMIEHMRNHRQLFNKIHGWLKNNGLFFMHIFVHKSQPYLFEVQDEDDWMSKYFFSGGMMPSDDLPLQFQNKLKIMHKWKWSGIHYEKTANAWLKNIDLNKNKAMLTLKKIYGTDQAVKWFHRWRIFFMSCAELWGYKNGQEWHVSHYLFKK
jgi:cyclopropane-fatty-acyl-phospholipid synthase